MEKVGGFKVRVDQVDGYEFRVRFEDKDFADLTVDEPPPLGKDHGPNPTRLLAAAVSNCLAASLLFCLQRAKAKVTGMSAEAEVELVRNEQRRLRVGHIDVRLRPGGLAPDDPALQACLGTFEDFCVVTQSVRQGLDVRVTVEPTG